MRKDDFNFHKCKNIDCKFEYYCTDDSEHNNPDDYYSNRVLTEHKENISNQEAKSSKIILSKIIHTDCWNYIKNKYNKELKYSDLKMIQYDNYSVNIQPMIFNIKNEKEKMLLFPPLNIDYGEIKHYWSKDYGFLIDNIIKDNKEYLLYSPLAQEKKLSRYNSINKKKN
jgi:hypothetical protein